MDIDKKKKAEHDRLQSATRYRKIVGSLFVIFVVAILYKVFSTMIVEGPRWREIASTLRPPREEPITPVRGNIYSADGKLLAISPPYYRIYFDFGSESFVNLQKKGLVNERLDSLANLAMETFVAPRYNKAELLAHWKKGIAKRSRHWDLAGKEISFLEYDQFMHAPIMYVRNEKGKRSSSSIYRCLYSDNVSRRQKPYAALASATIGNVYGTPDSLGFAHGSGGIELAYDSLLIGTPGVARRSYIGGRNTTTILKDPTPGANVYTTFAMDTQREVHKFLKKRLSELKAARGTAIVMEAATGRIIAMANLQHNAGGDSTSYSETYPIAFNDLMEPGSTFKAATMMALMDDGYVTPQSTFNVGEGYWNYGGATIKDGRQSRGTITYARAIEISSNIVPASSVVKYYGDNPQRYINKIKSFGFGQDLHLELPGYQTARIKDASDPRWSKLSLPWIAHGYETQIPPVMMLTFFNAIANGGTVFRPYLVDSVVSNSGEVLYKFLPQAIRDSICKPKTIGYLRSMLRGVVENGTGKAVNSPHVAICGKSGTAQIAQGSFGYRGAGKTHSVSFIGFFPYDNPRYTCLVNIISPRKDLYPSGGSMAGPVVREIAEYMILSAQRVDVNHLPLANNTSLSSEQLFPKPILYSDSEMLAQRMCMKIKPAEGVKATDLVVISNDSNPNQTLIAHKQSVGTKNTMPNLIGMSASTACFVAKKHGLNLRILGIGRVVGQTVPQGASITPGEMVIVTLAWPKPIADNKTTSTVTQ